MGQTLVHSPIEPWLEIVRQKVAAMRFGAVQIVVHEGRVTQVESTAKTRFAADETPPQHRAALIPLPTAPAGAGQNNSCRRQPEHRKPTPARP